MAAQSIRLSSMLTFDDAKEQDIINLIGELNSSHKTGQFISNLIRVAVDNPELLKCVSGRYSAGPILEQLDTLNQSFNRYQYFNNITSKVDEMHKKIDSMYDMVLKTYMLAQIGNKLGLEQKSENNILAQFVIEKQLRELEDLVGTNFQTSVLASNKKANVDKLTDEVLEHMINSYSTVIDALKRQVIPEVKTIEVPVQVQAIPQVQHLQSAPIHYDKPVEDVIEHIEVIKPPEIKEIQASETENQIIDFGADAHESNEVEEPSPVNFDKEADLDMLSAFFGM